MDRARLEECICTLAKQTASSTGRSYFSALAESMAEILDAPIAIVGMRDTKAWDAVESIALYADGEHRPPIRYALEGTPCSEVTKNRVCQFPKGARRLFPDDVLLVDMGVEAYFGVPIMDGEQCIGLMAVLDRRARSEIADLEPILRLFALRAAAEMRRMQAEEALRQSEERFRQIVTTSREGVWTVDAQGKTTYVNDRMAQMLGRDASEMMGWAAFAFMDEGDRAQAERHMRRRERGIAEIHEFTLLHRDGSPVHTEMTTAPLTDAEGQFVGALAMVADVSEQRRMRERAMTTQKLESLGLLAGGIAHDFNNLLVGVLGSAEIGLRHCGSDGPVWRAFEQIRASGQRAADLTQRLLSYAGESPFHPREIELNDVVRESVDLVRTATSEKAELRFDLSEDPLAVRGDGVQLMQVLMNLLTNASDAVAVSGGLITISSGIRDVKAREVEDLEFGDDVEPGHYAFIEVADDGPGMNEATRSRLFDPFFTTKAQGRGLGLSSVLGILRRHGGGIAVRSAPGEGAAFRIYLPLLQSLREPETSGLMKAASRPSEPPVRRPTALVVDDEEIVRSVIADILEDSGFRVVEAEDGVAALEILDAPHPHLEIIVLDMSMPRMNGAETMAAMRARGVRSPVIVVSGYSEAIARDRASLMDAEFLQKPFTAAALRDRVEKLVNVAPETTAGRSAS